MHKQKLKPSSSLHLIRVFPFRGCSRGRLTWLANNMKLLVIPSGITDFFCQLNVLCGFSHWLKPSILKLHVASKLSIDRLIHKYFQVHDKRTGGVFTIVFLFIRKSTNTSKKSVSRELKWRLLFEKVLNSLSLRGYPISDFVNNQDICYAWDPVYFSAG